MTPRFKVGLAVLGALVLATAGLWAVLGGLGKTKPTKTTAKTGTRTVLGPDGEPTLTVDSSGELAGIGEDLGSLPGEVRGTGGLPPGLREPSGEDLSDPRTVKRLLAEKLAESPVDWESVAELIKVLKEPLDADTKQRFMDELRTGHRHGVLRALEVLQDGSFASDLLQLLDDTQLSAPARQAVLQALEVLPSGDRDEIVRSLEARMTGDVRNDQMILRAIARRGGKEAARALVQYLQQSKDASRLQTFILGKLDLKNDREAAQFVAESLTADQPPETLRALLDLAAKPGAVEVVEPLIALNREGVPDDIRQSAIASLARVATDKAVDYLLTLAQQPGVYGELSIRAIGNIQDASKESLDRLVELGTQASQMPRPEKTKEMVLLALGQMKYTPALPLMGESLKDSSLEVRLSAVRGLGRVGQPSRSYVPELVSLYSTGDDTMRRSVVIALGTIGGDASRSALQQMEGDPSLSPGIRRNVLLAISNIEATTAAEQPEPVPNAPGLEGIRPR